MSTAVTGASRSLTTEADPPARPPKLHVALAHEGWPPVESFGGIVRYLVCLADGLRERGHDVTVIASGRVSQTEYTANGIRVVRIRPIMANVSGGVKGLLSPLAMSARFASALAAVDRGDPIDVVEFSNWMGEGLVHSLVKKRPHVTRVVTMGWQSRRLDPHSTRRLYTRVADRWRDWTEALPVRRSDVVVAPTLEHALSVGRRLRLNPTPEPSALGTSDESHDDASLATDIGREQHDLLFVGKLEPRKGFDTLVEAFARAIPVLPDSTRLLVVGSDTPSGPGGGSYREHVLASVARAVRSRIELLGWVSDGALADLYRRCAAVVAPSRYESFGLPFVEAMQHGKAVIGTTAGGIPEVVTDGVEGLLISPGDVNGLARAITCVATDVPFRLRLERAARRRYEHEFTKDAFAARAEAIYLRAIQARASSRS